MGRGDFPSTKQDQYMLRFPDGMRDHLKEIAARNNRSLNAEIVSRLEQSQDFAKLIDDYRKAEERLFEQVKTERELRRQIELLEEQIALLKNGEMEIDLASPGVQNVMIQRMKEVMDGVVEDMREDNRISSGIPLLLQWFKDNPDDRAEYDSLSDDEQDEYVRDKTQALWLEYLNAKRAARPSKKPTVKIPGRKVRLDDK